MPMVISSTKTTYRVGEAGPPVLTVAGSSGNVSWSCGAGTCYPETGTETTLSPDNVSRYADAGDALVVTATDLTTSEVATIAIDVYATFRFQPDWGYESSADEDAEISEAEGGEETIFQGRAHATYPFAFTDRSYTEFKEAELFRHRHGKVKLFYFENVALGELLRGRFDSALNRKPDSADAVSYSFVFKATYWQPADVEEAADWPLHGQVTYGSFAFD